MKYLQVLQTETQRIFLNPNWTAVSINEAQLLFIPRTARSFRGTLAKSETEMRRKESMSGVIGVSEASSFSDVILCNHRLPYDVDKCVHMLHTYPAPQVQMVFPQLSDSNHILYLSSETISPHKQHSNIVFA